MTPSVRVANLASAGPGGQHFLFTRVGDSLALQLHGDHDFEAGITSQHRAQAALSLESEQLGGFLIQHHASGQKLLARTSFILGAPPPAKPCFCISFIDTTPGGNGIDLLSILCHNEFQYTIGCYLHGKGTFIHYSKTPLDASLSLLKSESIDTMLLDLARLDQTEFFAKCVREGPIGHALALGFNHSFGHAHWNDIVGLQHRHNLIQSGLLRPLASLVVYGPSLWLSQSLLSSLPCKLFEDAAACAEWTLQQRISIHLPIGFHVDAGYEDFWRSRVARNADGDFRTSLLAWCTRKHPIILISLRFNEQKRSAWINRTTQVMELMSRIKSEYPNCAFMLDGLTSYSRRSGSKNNTSDASELLEIISGTFHVLNLHNRTLQDKIFAYSFVNYCIGQFGSGTLLPGLIYDVPTINICSDADTIDLYSGRYFITNLAKPAESTFTRFLPFNHVIQAEDGFFLNIDTAYSFVSSDLQAAIDGSLSFQLKPYQP